MTVCPSNDYSESMDDNVRYRFSACRRCGATTEAQAAKVCRPSQMPSGEYSCPSDGEGWLEDTFDRKGRHVTPTRKSMAETINSWVEFQKEYDARARAEKAARVASAGVAS